jgi:hypothetical protein
MHSRGPSLRPRGDPTVCRASYADTRFEIQFNKIYIDRKSVRNLPRDIVTIPSVYFYRLYLLRASDSGFNQDLGPLTFTPAPCDKENH